MTKIIRIGSSQAGSPYDGKYIPFDLQIPGYDFNGPNPPKKGVTFHPGASTEDLVKLIKKKIKAKDIKSYDEIWIMAGSNDRDARFAETHAAKELLKHVVGCRKNSNVPIWYIHNTFGAAGKDEKQFCQFSEGVAELQPTKKG